MANSMIDSILEMVTPEMKEALASKFGASPQAVTTGLGTATAATLGALATKAGDTGLLNQIVGLVSGSSGQSILGSLSSLGAGGTSGGIGDMVNKFLPMVFGGSQDQATNLIAQKAGLNAASASAILKTAAPLLLGFLAKMSDSGTLSAGSLGNMLRAEAPNLQRFIPAGFFGGVKDAAGAVTRPVSEAAAAVGSGNSSTWLMLLGVAAALVVAWLVYNALGNKPAAVTDSATNAVGNAATAVGNTANAAWAALGNFFKVKLPDGTVLNVPELGVENKLVIYLNDPSKSVETETWFDFDRLLFDTGKATLQPASQEQLGNIAAILKAYPKVKIRIGGYTDNTGDASANMRLSDDRAGNVMAELARLGVDASRMSAKGYGEEHPVADNSTEEGRQKNRRISLRVTEK
jgi:OmpA-OmpF porin, OOP family